MKHYKSPNRLAHFSLFMLLVIATSTGFGQAPKPSQAETDPIIGRWRWSNAQIVILNADGTAQSDGGTGVWKVLSTGTPRKYEINWSDRYLDTVRLVKNGKQLEGTSKGVGKISAERLPNK